MLRILLLAPGANPDVITGPLIGYFHGEALARLHAVTLVIRSHNEEAVRRTEDFESLSREVVSTLTVSRLALMDFLWHFLGNLPR